MKLNSLSFFMPAYNERENIKIAIYSALKICKQIAKKFEIIVVGGISTDGTDEIVKSMCKKIKELRFVDRGEEREYGQALKVGFKSCKYEWIFYTDSDNQFELEDLKRFLKYCKNYDLIIGYRVRRKDPYLRIVIAKVFSLLVSFFIFKRIKDVDCAFKLVKKSVIDKIEFKTVRSADVELIVNAKRMGFKIKQLPVRHYKRLKGSSEIQTRFGLVKFEVILISLKELFQIIFRL